MSLASLELSDPHAGLRAEFHPEAGMLCSSLRLHGQELLDPRRGVEVYAREGRTMGVPLLYPWANRLGGGGYEAAGRRVAVDADGVLVSRDPNGLPIHGVIGGRLPWRAECEGPSRLSARLPWSHAMGEPWRVFPFAHEVLYSAALEGGRLVISVTVRATAQDPVPVAFGFHPYLHLPGAVREVLHVELPSLQRIELDDHQIPVRRGARQGAQAFGLGTESFDDGFAGPADGASFAVADARHSVTVELLEGWGFSQVYAPAAESFICFEPMTAPADALRSGEGLRVLAPGETHRAVFALVPRRL